MELTGHWIGLAALLVFVVAYGSVAAEDRLHLRKSIPVLVAAGLIWPLIGLAYAARGDTHAVAEAAGALPWARAAGVRAALAVPLLAGDRIVGALAVGHRASDRRFTEDDAAALTAVAEVATAALR